MAVGEMAARNNLSRFSFLLQFTLAFKQETCSAKTAASLYNRKNVGWEAKFCAQDLEVMYKLSLIADCQLSNEMDW